MNICSLVCSVILYVCSVLYAICVIMCGIVPYVCSVMCNMCFTSRNNNISILHRGFNESLKCLEIGMVMKTEK